MRPGVLLIGNYPPPYGGVPRYIENLAPFLVERGWDVHVLSGGRTGVEHREGLTIYKLPLGAKAGLVLRHAVPLGRSPIGIRVRSARDAITRAWYQVLASAARDIVQRHRIRLLCGFNLSRGGLIAAVVGRERRVPVVVNNFGELLSNEAFFRANPGILPFVAGTAARLVSGSRHCAATYGRFGLAPAVDVIPYGVDAARFRPDVDGGNIRRRMGAGPADVVVLFLGRHIREMGLDTLLAVVPGLLAARESIRVLVAGASGELSNAARTVAAASAGRVTVVENVPYGELPAFYAGCDLLAAPTEGDRACSSLAAAEALATARPVVASAVGGIPELVRDGETGALVPPGDADALREAVLGLAADRARRGALGARGRQLIEAEWDTRRVLARMADVFDEAAGTAG